MGGHWTDFFSLSPGSPPLTGGLNPIAPGARTGTVKETGAKQQKPQFAVRGAYIPYILGRRETGSVVLWAGGRRKEGESVGGFQSVDLYHEHAWHGICVGPASALFNVKIDDVLYVRDVIRSEGNEDGGNNYGENGGAGDGFDLWWGLRMQDKNEWLSDSNRVGVESRWPYLMYAVWYRRELGTSPTWPRITYEPVVLPEAPLDLSPAWMDETEEGRGDWGVNVAHCLWHIVTKSFPRGIGAKVDRIDYGRLNALGQVIQGEHLPINILAEDGVSALETIDSFITPLGINFAQLGRTLVAFPIRPTVSGLSIPDLTVDVVAGSLPETELLLGDPKYDRTEYAFKDQRINWKENVLVSSDDGFSLERRRVNTQRVNLEHVTSQAVAVKVADIQEQINFGERRTISLEIIRKGRQICSGMPFTFNGRRYRAQAVQLSPFDRGANIKALLDTFDVAAANPVYDDPGGIGDDDAPQLDLAFDYIELPAGLGTGSKPQIMPLRWRATEDTEETRIHISSNGSSYDRVGEVRSVAAGGGTLLDGISARASAIIEEGPLFDPGDVVDNGNEILDLDSDPNGWRTGKQLAIINGEIFFLRSVTLFEGESHIRLNGLIRARYDTLRGAHAIGDRVFIVRRIDRISNSVIEPGAAIYMKTEPKRNGERVDLMDVDPVVHRIRNRRSQPLAMSFKVGTATGPYKPLNKWKAGDGLILNWRYRLRDAEGAGAGDLPAGVPVPADAGGAPIVPEPDGPARIELRSTERWEIVDAENGAPGVGEIWVEGDHEAALNVDHAVIWIEGCGGADGNHEISLANYEISLDRTFVRFYSRLDGALPQGEIGWMRKANVAMTKSDVASGTFSISNGDLAAAFGGEPSELEIRMIQQKDSSGGGVSKYESTPRRVVVTKI